MCIYIYIYTCMVFEFFFKSSFGIVFDQTHFLGEDHEEDGFRLPQETLCEVQHVHTGMPDC